MLEFIRKALTSKSILKHYLLVTSALFTFGFLFYLLYPLFSMLVFGEQENSFLYSMTNDIIYVLGIYLFPVLILTYKMLLYGVRKKDYSRAKDYIMSFVTITLMYIPFFAFMII